MSRAGTIDGLQFARDRGVVTGVIAIEDLPRLAAMGCKGATLRYTVRGDRGESGQPCLNIEVLGRLQLVCQRCLGLLDFPLALANELDLAKTLQEIEGAEDDIDRVLATHSMAVAELVEDEAMLALPMVPMHDRCERPIAQSDRAESSPFAELAKIRSRGTGPERSH